MLQADVQLSSAVVVELDPHVHLGYGRSARRAAGNNDVPLRGDIGKVFKGSAVVVLPTARGCQWRSEDRPRDARNRCLGNGRLVTSGSQRGRQHDDQHEEGERSE